MCVTGCWLWTGASLRYSRACIHTRNCYIMVSCTGGIAWRSTLFMSRGHLVNWMHFFWDGHAQTIVSGRFRNWSAVPYVPVSFKQHLRPKAFRGQLIATEIILFSILKTPTEDIWPGVTCLPDYKETFPCWTSHQLKEQVAIYTYLYLHAHAHLSYQHLLMQLLIHPSFL